MLEGFTVKDVSLRVPQNAQALTCTWPPTTSYCYCSSSCPFCCCWNQYLRMQCFFGEEALMSETCSATQDWWTASMARGSLVNELLDPFWMCCPVLTDLYSISIYTWYYLRLTSYPSWLIHSLSCAGEWYFLQPERTVSFLRSELWRLKKDNKFCTLLNHYPPPPLKKKRKIKKNTMTTEKQPFGFRDASPIKPGHFRLSC